MIQLIDTNASTSAPMLPLLKKTECSGLNKNSVTKHKIKLKPRKQPKAKIPPSNASVTSSGNEGSPVPLFEPSSTSAKLLLHRSQFSFSTPRPTLSILDNIPGSNAAPMLPILSETTCFRPLRRLSLNPRVNRRTNGATDVQEIEKTPVPDFNFAITRDHVYETPKATMY